MNTENISSFLVATVLLLLLWAGWMVAKEHDKVQSKMDDFLLRARCATSRGELLELIGEFNNFAFEHSHIAAFQARSHYVLGYMRALLHSLDNKRWEEVPIVMQK